MFLCAWFSHSHNLIIRNREYSAGFNFNKNNFPIGQWHGENGQILLQICFSFTDFQFQASVSPFFVIYINSEIVLAHCSWVCLNIRWARRSLSWLLGFAKFHFLSFGSTLWGESLFEVPFEYCKVVSNTKIRLLFKFGSFWANVTICCRTKNKMLLHRKNSPLCASIDGAIWTISFVGFTMEPLFFAGYKAEYCIPHNI